LPGMIPQVGEAVLMYSGEVDGRKIKLTGLKQNFTLKTSGKDASSSTLKTSGKDASSSTLKTGGKDSGRRTYLDPRARRPGRDSASPTTLASSGEDLN
jgi:hypothetical protein